MPSTRTEKKIAELRIDPRKRQRPAVEELAQEGQNKRPKRVRTSEAEGQLNARKETVRRRQKEGEVSKLQVVTRRSTRQTKSTKKDQPHDSKQVSPQSFAGKADNISVAEVAEMVKRLNAEIYQMSSLVADSLSSRRLPGFGSELGMELNDYLGAELCNELQRRSNKVNTEPGPLITQITLQTGLVNTCSRIIMNSDWNHPSWVNDPTISRIVSNMERAEQAVAANTRKDYMIRAVSLRENQEVYEKYLTEVLLKLITTVGAVGGSTQSSVTLPSLEGIIRQAIELQRIISKDVTSAGLVTYTVLCDEEFDPSQMENVKWDDDEEIATAPLGRVACTVEMGLCCRQRVDSGNGIGVVVKPKIVLAAALESCYTASEKKLQQLLQMNAEKFSSMEVEANRRNEDHARDIGRLEVMIVELKQLVQELTTELRDIEGTASERVHVLSATTSKAQGVKRRKAATGQRDINMQGEQAHNPSTSVRKPDSISVAEVAELIRILNAQIEQVSILMADSLSYNETLSSGEVRIALDGLDDRVGQWLYSNLWSRSKRQMGPDPLITQIAIQTGLVNVCCGIVNGSTHDVAGTRTTDAPRARVHSHIALSQSERKESVQNYLMDLLAKIITAARGSPETLHSQYSEKVEDITMKAIELHKIVSQDVTSVELSTYTIPCDTSFDPSQMEDTEGEGGDMTVPVVCTLDMGLWCRKKVHAKQSGIEGDVTMKAKVVLATTLETEIPR